MDCDLRIPAVWKMCFQPKFLLEFLLEVEPNSSSPSLSACLEEPKMKWVHLAFFGNDYSMQEVAIPSPTPTATGKCCPRKMKISAPALWWFLKPCP